MIYKCSKMIKEKRTQYRENSFLCFIFVITNTNLYRISFSFYSKLLMESPKIFALELLYVVQGFHMKLIHKDISGATKA